MLNTLSIYNNEFCKLFNLNFNTEYRLIYIIRKIITHSDKFYYIKNIKYYIFSNDIQLYFNKLNNKQSYNTNEIKKIIKMSSMGNSNSLIIVSSKKSNNIIKELFIEM
jgi:hypothetical protein